MFWLPKRYIFGRNITFIDYSRLLSKYFFGLGYLLRKAAMASDPTVEVTNTGNTWKIVTATILKTMTLEFEMVKFIYSEKATKFCEIFTLLLTVCTVVKSKVKILQNFVAFSEYMNFKCRVIH